MYKPVFCTKTDGCLHLSDALGEEDMYVNAVGPPVKTRIHSSRVPAPPFVYRILFCWRAR